MTPLKQSYWCSLSALLLRNFRETVAENPLQINQKNHTLNCVSGFSSTWVVLTWVYSMPVINRSNVLPSPRKTNENKRLSRFSHLIKNIKINKTNTFANSEKNYCGDPPCCNTGGLCNSLHGPSDLPKNVYL